MSVLVERAVLRELGHEGHTSTCWRHHILARSHLCALIDFTTTALLCVIVFWHRLGWLDRDLAGVVTVMAITEYAILSVLIGAVEVSIWLGFRGREF